MNKKPSIIIICLLLFLASCSMQKGPITTKLQAYPYLYEEKPLTIMVMPPINRSTKVEAKMAFYHSLCLPLANKGYYVLPPLLTMKVLEEQSVYDSELFIDRDAEKFGTYFGADAVLFTVIDEWRKVTVGNFIEVKIHYILKSTKTNNILYERTGNITYSPQTDSGSLLADLIANRIVTALSNELPVAQACNINTLIDLPDGKYGLQYQKDSTTQAGEKEFYGTYSY